MLQRGEVNVTTLHITTNCGVISIFLSAVIGSSNYTYQQTKDWFLLIGVWVWDLDLNLDSELVK